MNKVIVYTQAKKYAKAGEEAKRVARRALRMLGQDGAYAEIFVISDAEIRKINKSFRGKDKATNVLSFAEAESGKFLKKRGKAKNLGEIYIAPDFIKKEQLRRFGRSPDSTSGSLAHMVVHGLLHLLGYDHLTKKDAEKMEKKEIDILKKVR
jgi:probable rRNA maturation factor